MVNGPGDSPETLRKPTLSYQRNLPIAAMDMMEQVASGRLLEAHFS
jgi:hypothetical protein